MRSADAITVAVSNAAQSRGGHCERRGRDAALAAELAARGPGTPDRLGLGLPVLDGPDVGGPVLGERDVGGPGLSDADVGRLSIDQGVGEPGFGEPPIEPELCDGDCCEGSGRPSDPEEDLPAELLIAQAEAAAAAAAPELLPAGFLLRDGEPTGTGFSSGGVLDNLEPGPVLAGFAADADAELPALSDDELVGVVRAWRRLSSWTAARELAAVSELLSRREQGRGMGAGLTDPGCDPFDCTAAELGCALTMTRRSAERLADTALALRDLPGTAAALAAGRIDMPRALVILDRTTGVERHLIQRVEARVLEKAPGQTTGELRAAVRLAVLAVDPAAALRRRERAEKEARVELWDEPAGTKALAGRDMPPAEVLAADKRISALARWLKANGAEGTMDQLRARAYLSLLVGQPAEDLLPADAPPRAENAQTADSTPGQPKPGDGAPGDGAPGDDAPAPEASGRVPSEGVPSANASGTAPDEGAPGASVPGAPDADPPGTSAPGANPPHAIVPGAPDADLPGTSVPGAAGTDPPGTRAPGADPFRADPTGADPAGADLRGYNGIGSAGLIPTSGSLNLTVPLETLLGYSEAPGHAGGFGPVDAPTARDLAGLVGDHPTTPWCVTVTDRAGRAIGHGCGQRHNGSGCRGDPPAGETAGTRVGSAREPAHRSPGGEPVRPGTGSGSGGWTQIVIRVGWLAAGQCAHERETASYQPSQRLRHLIEIRDQRCAFPGCRRPAAQCDLDHTTPYDKGGLTCECNISPLCRAHHRVKQASGWRLKQPEPGHLEWTTPAGRTYSVRPGPV